MHHPSSSLSPVNDASLIASRLERPQWFVVVNALLPVATNFDSSFLQILTKLPGVVLVQGDGLQFVFCLCVFDDFVNFIGVRFRSRRCYQRPVVSPLLPVTL